MLANELLTSVPPCVHFFPTYIRVCREKTSFGDAKLVVKSVHGSTLLTVRRRSQYAYFQKDYLLFRM